MFFLYRHIRLDKNVPFYIGIGKKYSYSKYNAYMRASFKKGRNPIWNNITKKTDYEVEILIESDDENFIKAKESEFIKLYGRLDIKTGTLANMSDGYDADFNMSPLTKKKLSERMKGNQLGKFQDWGEERRKRMGISKKGNTTWRGRKHKPESKALISAAKKGKKLSNQHINNLFNSRATSKKIYCFNNGVIYNSICECVRELFNCKLSVYDNIFRNYKNHISKVCNGKKENYKKYKFKFI